MKKKGKKIVAPNNFLYCLAFVFAVGRLLAIELEVGGSLISST